MKKAKQNLRFPSAHRGYNIDAVESFLSAEQARNDGALLAARERISVLEAQCGRLESELNDLKSKEEQIKTAFISATQNAEQLTADIKARYAFELDRLRLFRAKWTGEYEQLKERYHFDKDALNMESVAVSVGLELQKFLTQDFSLNKGESADEMEMYFKSEVARLTAQQAAEQKDEMPPSPALDDLKSKLREAEQKKDESAAFSLDEALHPTESLADICRALGLKAL